MGSNKIKEMMFCGLAMAIVFIMTVFISIPIGQFGYVNVGDGGVLLFSTFLHPFFAFLGNDKMLPAFPHDSDVQQKRFSYASVFIIFTLLSLYLKTDQKGKPEMLLRFAFFGLRFDTYFKNCLFNCNRFFYRHSRAVSIGRITDQKIPIS